MTVVGYANDGGLVYGAFNGNVPSLESFQKGYLYNPLPDINADISDVGGDVTQPYFISWTLLLQTSALLKNAPIYQSPLTSSAIAVVAFLSQGSVIQQQYLNFMNQKFGFFEFWNLVAYQEYPYTPPIDEGGEFDTLLAPSSLQYTNADSFIVYPQFASADFMGWQLTYLAVLNNSSGDTVITNLPLAFSFD
jgi:hypothetical protein